MKRKQPILSSHKAVREWMIEHGGVPALHQGRLQVNFPDQYGDENLDEITWRDFFIQFDEQYLGLQPDELSSISTRYRFVPRTS